MKSIIGLVIFLALCCLAVGLFFGYHTTKDPGHQLAMAFSATPSGELQIQCGIGPGLTMRDPPERNSRGAPLWSEWVAEHFHLRDAEGNELPFQRMGTSGLFLDDRAAGAPEFVIHTDVKKGKQYTFDYIEVRGEDKVYRCTLTVPDGPEKVRRFQFDRFDNDDV